MIRFLIASLILGILAAAYPERLRGWVERLLRSFPSLQKCCLRFIDRLLSDLDHRYPIGVR
jgi:hypothetical protein